MNTILTVLNTRRLPARLNCDQAAAVLGVQPHDVPVLIAANLLKPLGNPVPNAQKYFSATEIEELARDRAWLDRVTKAISKYWQRKNGAKLHRVGEAKYSNTRPSITSHEVTQEIGA